MRVVVTRGSEQGGELIELLTRRGAEVLALPMVRFAPPEDSRALDEHLRHLNRFGAVLFLSANAVRYVFERCRELGIALGAECAARPMIAAVGPATARALAEYGAPVDYVAREHTGEGLARELKDSLPGKSVLLPRSDRGNDAISQTLSAGRARVTEVVAYHTARPDKLDESIVARLCGGEVDAVTFASPSAVQNFAALLGADAMERIAARTAFAAIGPTTAQALRDAGLPVAIEAAEPSAQGFAAAMERYYFTDSMESRRRPVRRPK